MARVLIADDEANLRKVLQGLLKKDGHDTLAVATGDDALTTIRQEEVDVLITDLKMPGLSGLELLEVVKREYPNLPVIVITAHGTVETAVRALKKGARDYITKPFDKDELKLAVRKCISARQMGGASSQPRAEDVSPPQMIGGSTKMQAVFAIIDKVAATPSTVLVTGESGTGKELVATGLHEKSPRHAKPLIKVNCAAIPKDLMESEFFGHEKGAFTGAISSKPGRFELADGGTLFLDEIGEIPIDMQVKLLRALQDGSFERVGGVKTMQVDVRVIAATNRDLQKEVESGAFREDLYYRLNVVPVALPPLREREDDIDALVEAFLNKYNKRLGKDVKEVGTHALAALRQHHWPGNIRELENVIERMVLFAEGSTIEESDLPDEITKNKETTIQTASRPDNAPLPALENGTTSMKDIVRQATADLEKDLIIRALEETSGNVTRAAHLLKISRKGLQNKMKEFGLREEKP